MDLLTGLFARKSYTVGLDIGFDSIKLAGLRDQGSGVAVESLAYGRIDAALPRESEVTRVLKEIFQNYRLKGRKVSASISHRDLAVRYFSLPKMTAAEMREAIAWEAPKHLPFPLKGAVFDHVVVSEGDELGGGNLIMVAALPEETATLWIRTLSRAGITLDALDASGMALLAYFDLVHGWKDGESRAVLNFGHQFTGINIFKDAKLRLTRDIGIAGADMNQAISEVTGYGDEEAGTWKHRFGLSGSPEADADDKSAKARIALEQAVEKIAVEAQRSFDFYTSQYREQPIGELHITGGGALIPGMREYMEEHLALKVKLEDPFESLPLDDRLRRDAVLMRMGPFFTVAIGLATRRAS